MSYLGLVTKSGQCSVTIWTCYGAL